MRRLAPVLILALALFCSAAACSNSSSKATPPQSFCAATDKLDAQIANATPEQQLELVRALSTTAPPDLKAKADLWLEGMERVVVRKEQVSAAERKRYEAAATDLQRVAIQQCKILQKNRSGAGI